MTALAQRLRRRTVSGNWMPEIDGLRFLAILAVLLFHMQGELGHHGVHPVQARYLWLAAMVGAGNRGVQLFFVISGYILARPFAAQHLFGKPRPPLRKYFLRRVTRLEPPYILNLLVCAGCFLALNHVPWPVVWRHLAASVLYLHYVFFRDSYTTLNSVAWSLEVEVQFYLLAPLLSTVFLIRQAMWRRSVLVLAMPASAWLQMRLGLGPLTLAGQLQYFLAGLLLADLALTTMKAWPHDGRWDVVSLFGWPLAFLPVAPWLSFWFPPLIVLLYVAALRGRVMYRLVRLEWIAIFGGMCYTIYLWHPLILSFVQAGLDRVARFMPTDYALYFALQAVPKLAAVAGVSVVLFALVERPCMDQDWPQRLLRSLRRLFAPPGSDVSTARIPLEES